MFFLKLSLLTLLIAGPGLVTCTENEITCEGNVQRLSCDTGVIRVTDASYGRTDRRLCSAGRPRSEVQNTNCFMENLLNFERCNGQTACEINTKELSNPDPCFGTYKYYNTTYECIRARVSMTCEGSYSTLDCGNDEIRIVGANYGRTDCTICSEGVSKELTRNTNCQASTSLSTLVTRCNDKRSCFLEASDSVFSDPCLGTYKYLAVTYFCRPHPFRTVLTCEGSTANLACGVGFLKIHSANYGRTDSTTCSGGWPVGQTTKTDCYASNTLDEVVRRCEAKSNCLVPATNAVFSDPCVYTYKYLVIDYLCV